MVHSLARVATTADGAGLALLGCPVLMGVQAIRVLEQVEARAK